MNTRPLPTASNGLDVLVLSPEGLADSGLPIAAARAGAVGLLNLCHFSNRTEASVQLNRLVRLARGRYGAVLHGRLGPVEQEALEILTGADTILLTCAATDHLAEAVTRWRGVARRLGLIVTSETEARLGVELGVDLLVAKGNETGGQVGEETTFVLLQRLLSRLELPVYAWGGVGRSTAAACRAAGATGVVLDWQLALMRESAVATAFRRRLALMDGSETVAVRGPDGSFFRVYAQPGMPAKDQLLALSEKLSQEEHADPDAWERTIATLMADADPEARLWPVGQDAAFAATWAAEAPTVARALRLLEEHVEQAVRAGADAGTLQAHSPLARSHGTDFPVLQGPMTRVSDVPEFCEAVAVGGGLPFLALALLRRAQVRDLLERTRARMGNRPWGVGILGFAERELRAEQLEAVEEVRPPFAIIAGGRPDQAASLEARGIATYLHVPSPGMLDTFVREGARRFIFEGRECGGHVGPRSSFVLWETMIGVLLRAELPAAEAAKVHVVFAGGIHDGRSGAMIAALAQPLVERGMKVGVLLGTAYLFTEEIVRTGAILPGFQEVALRTDHTVLVETGPGHAIRCADTPYVRHFESEKQRLRRQARPAEEIRSELEAMNLGRLRIASKGVARLAQRTEDRGQRTEDRGQRTEDRGQQIRPERAQQTSPGHRPGTTAATPARSPEGAQQTSPGHRPGDGKPEYVRLDEEVQRRDGMYMIGQVAALRQGRCTIRELHEEICQGAQARLDALRRQPVVSVEPAEPAPPPLDIAIVGMACLLPGATTPEEFWHNILAKRDLIGEVPAHRFDAARWYDPERSARDKVNSKWGGFLDDIPFDPLKFGIPPAALRSIEPGQLLALELVDRALTDAGYADHNPARARTSVIFGFSGGLPDLGQKYIVRAQLPQWFAEPDAALWEQLPEWTEDSFAGILPNVIAGRVCNRFDFGGANFTVDAACASSLAAIYLACRSLADGTSDMVITGGCDVVQNAFAYLCFSKSGALSPRGRSRAFDAGADGIAISEGLAAVVLKRLADAERDGDRIYAVIRGVGAGSDGRSKGLTAPRVEGQMRTLERAYAQAGFSPATVGLFEAHGTGTAVGDATECQSLTAVLNRHGARPRSAALGSVKSMIGHTKSSAGVAGLMKAALALHHRVLPPTLHVENPNPKAGLIDGPLYVNSELRPWLRGEQMRRAAVSSFGFGGTNFHVVLEEYEDHALSPGRQTPHRRWPAELFTFAAKSGADLMARVRGFAAEVRAAREAGAELELADLAYTLHRRGVPAGATYRVAVVASSVPELLEQLDEWLGKGASGGRKPPDSTSHQGAYAPRSPLIYYTDQPLGVDAPLAFVFPGQGAQFPDMLRDLTVEFAEVSDTFARADAVLSERYGGPLSRFIFPPPAFSDAERSQAAEALKATRVTQPALGVCGLALLRLLASFQVKPALAAGHSYGELVALCAAGSLDEAGLLQLSWARAEAMSPVAPANGENDLGTMIAVQADRTHVGEVLAGCADVWLANHNSPRQVVVSGSRQGVTQAAKLLQATGIAQTPLAVSCAFHSPLMKAARRRFDQALEATDFQPPAFPVYSNVTAAPHAADPRRVRELLSEQITHEVRFVDEVEALYAAGARVFVELGPGRVAAKLVDQILGDRPHAAVAVQWRERHGLTQLLHALGGLFAHGVALSLERLYEGRAVRQLDLRTPAALVKPPLGPHVWLVNGGDARPASEPRRSAKPLVKHSPKSEAPNGYAGSNGSAPMMKPHTNGDISKVKAMTARVSSPTITNGHVSVPSLPADADAYAQFQETMRRFLETQQRVMETFLLGTGIPAAPVDPAPVAEEPVIVGQAFQPEFVDQAGEPDGQANGQAGKPDLQKPPNHNAAHTNGTPAAAPAVPLEDLLLGIASERTGYPADMLALDANLEADLGVDSIKRVEIIAAFRRAALPSLAEPPAWFMERMTAAKTLRTICQGVAELVGGQKTEDRGQRTEDRGQKNGTVEPHHAEAPPAASGEDLKELLLQIASERTGYPAEMLSLEANLEADLGIDSIKRVEIIGAFRRAAVPALKEPPTWFMEDMTAAKTFRAIVDGVARLCGEGVDGRAPAKAQGLQSVGLTESAPRCVAGVVEIPLLPQDAGTLPAGAFILTDDGQGFAQELAHAIEVQGGRGCLLRSDDLATRERTAQAVERVRQEHGPIAGVIHLLPLQEAPAFPDVDETTWSEFADSELKGMFFLLQALAPELGRAASTPIAAICLSRGGGDFGGKDESRHPWRGGLAGLLKTAALEWSGARFRTIDVDELPSPEQLLREVVQEGPVEIGYRHGRRLTLRAQRQELPATDPAAPAVHLGRDSVVLVTGGAQGITAEVIQELAEHTQATFILLGRSPEPPAQEEAATAGLSSAVEIRRALATRCRETGVAVTPRDIEARVQALLKAREIRKTLTAVRNTGARVEYVACDVRDAVALRAVVADVIHRQGGIDALVHGAGIIEDAFIRDKTVASFDRVLATKVTPLLTLTRVLDLQRLKLVMLFSSVAGFFGNRGQGDYAAANEMLNRLARCLRRRWPGKVVSLNWGPWTGAGMVTPEVARQFTERGVPLVTVPAGRRAAWREVLHRGGSEVIVVVGPGPWVDAAPAAPLTLPSPPPGGEGRVRGADVVRVHTPLLADQQVYRRPGEVIEARVVLDGERHFFLRHHRIDGKPVLPLAVALEFMAEAAAAAQPDWHVTHVRNLRMYSGVVLDGRQRELLLRAEPGRRESDGGEWHVRITDPHKKNRRLYEATVRLARELPPAPAAPPVEPIHEAFPMSTDKAYEQWLFHGPGLQVIEQLTGLDAQGLDAVALPARVRQHAGSTAHAGWLIDPVVLDAAPQMAQLWSQATYGTTVLPNSLQTYHRYGPIGTEPVEMRWRVDPGHDEHTVKGRVWFLRGGRVVGQMDGLEVAGNVELNRIVGGPR